MLSIKHVVYLVFFLNYSKAIPLQEEAATCQSCHEIIDGKINVHLVPHSHDDVGWLKTFQQYFYGTGNFHNQGEAGVQYIINSVVEELKKDPSRRFIQVETAFFWKWWLEQTDKTRQDVQKLVNSGQLEIINGAYSMNDEAASHYQSIIDQFTWGFRILHKTLGDCGHPKIGWQIDPFGHSKEHAALLKQFGFEGLVIGRLDYRDKEQRRKERNLDFSWKTSEYLEDAELFTTMFPDFYVDEAGFHFDILVQDSITDSNLNSKVAAFSQILKKYQEYYKTSNIMMPMGSDFTYQVASRNYENMDRLIKGFENHETYNVFYSTPSCYIQAVKNEVTKKEIQLKVKEDDFFPYASAPNEYWTGYFTSRATSKRLERMSNNILQNVKQLTTLSRINGIEYDNYTLNLREALGVMQHHDAITGTAKQAVADDYIRMMVNGVKTAEQPLTNIILDFLKKDTVEHDILNFEICLLRNVSICESSQKDHFVVVVQNPLSRTISNYVRLPIQGATYRITGPDGEETYEIFDTIHSFDHLNNIGKVSSQELVFVAKNLPPLGLKLYYFEKIDEALNNYKPFEKVEGDVKFGTEDNGFTIDATSGKLQSITFQKETHEITQEFLYYTTTASGAYIFNALENKTREFVITETKGAKGELVDELLQIYGNEVRQIIRVYKGPNEGYIEFDWLVGDLQLDENKGKEVVTRYTIKNFQNNKIFYTDSNGRQMIKRTLDNRNDYNYDPTSEVQPIASNYYPVTSKISIKDETQNLQLAVMNDRAEGGTSLKDGEIELMLQRKLIRDDGKGVGEVLDEKEFGKGIFARGQHVLTFGSTPGALEKKLAQEKMLEPLVLVADATSQSLENLEKLINFKFESLTKVLPDNVQILTLEPWMDSYILRLEHILEKGDDVELSQPVTVDLNGLFTQFNITDLKETTLAANEVLTDVQDLKIVLNPMQIRTFIFTTDKNNKGGNDDGAPFDNDDGNNDGSKPYATLATVIFVLVLMIF